jgi:hypothetical protein
MELMYITQFRNAWHAGVTADESGEVRQAVARLYVQLGRVYVWPIATFDDDLALTRATYKTFDTTSTSATATQIKGLAASKATFPAWLNGTSEA